MGMKHGSPYTCGLCACLRDLLVLLEDCSKVKGSELVLFGTCMIWSTCDSDETPLDWSMELWGIGRIVTGSGLFWPMNEKQSS